MLNTYRFWNGWAPWTLVDDTREIHKYGDGFLNFDEWIQSFKDKKPVYEVFSQQENIVMVWFEAQAMFSQFQHYCVPYRVPFTPFKGDPSIPHKWKIAKMMSELFEEYEKPIQILYFGDYEPFKNKGSRAKGITIGPNAFEDIEEWFYIQLAQGDISEKEIEESYPLIEFERVGLNEEHVERWDIPENPIRRGEYQWEALNDEQAGELITESIERYWNKDRVDEIKWKENRDAERWGEKIDRILEGSE